MGAIKVPTNFNIELDFEVPEFYRRMIALMIDMLIQYFYLRIAGEIFDSILRNRDYFDNDSQHNLWALSWLLVLPIMLYHFVLELTMNGQSIGKKILGLRVVDELGGKPSFSQFVIRWLLRLSDVWIVILLFYILSLVADNGEFDNAQTVLIIVFGLGFLVTDIVLVVSSKKGQRIGDILAKTHRVYGRS